MIRGSVEETLNEPLEKEAESLTLHMLRLKGAAFETDIIERYLRRESGIEEAFIEMYRANGFVLPLIFPLSAGQNTRKLPRVSGMSSPYCRK